MGGGPGFGALTPPGLLDLAAPGMLDTFQNKGALDHGLPGVDGKPECGHPAYGCPSQEVDRADQSPV
ncbi:hypothetical protein MCP1_10172 [Candidatus Terasakiella magnetica]|nr:hypothetical protein MCP1_10172 [Candidatus Terasakiella magnetica]